MKLKGIIFDLDGTLLHTLDDLADSANNVFARHGLPVHVTEQYLGWIGNGAYNLIQQALPEGLKGDDSVKQYLLEFFDEYAGNWNKKSYIYEGIEKMLAQLSAKNIAVAVLSNKQDGFTKQIVSAYFPGYDFKAVFGEREGIPRKPDPLAALEIAEIMDLLPREILFTGDSPGDIKTARAANMAAGAVLWGYRSRETLTRENPDYLFNHPREIEHEFKK